jgi:hypothetical protein
LVFEKNRTVGGGIGHLVQCDQAQPRRGRARTGARAREGVAGGVVAGVELGAGDAAVLRDLRPGLGLLRAGEQPAGRNPLGDERPVVGPAIEGRGLVEQPLAREVVDEDVLDEPRSVGCSAPAVPSPS